MPADFSTPPPREAGSTPQGTAWSRYGAGPPLVLIHGVGMAGDVWAPQVNSLSASFDVIVYSMWGHGNSALPEGPLTLEDYARQLLDLLDHLGVDRTHVVGHSMGALVALEFALDHPQRCGNVVAMNAVFSRSESQRAQVRQRADELLTLGVRANLEETIRRWFGDPVEADRVSAERLSRRLLQSADPQGYARAYQVFATSDTLHAARLPGLQPKTLFFTGEFDPNSTPAMSQAMARLAPHGSTRVLAGHRHMMSLTAPEQVSDVLREVCSAATEGHAL